VIRKYSIRSEILAEIRRSRDPEDCLCLLKTPVIRKYSVRPEMRPDRVGAAFGPDKSFTSAAAPRRRGRPIVRIVAPRAKLINFGCARVPAFGGSWRCVRFRCTFARIEFLRSTGLDVRRTCRTGSFSDPRSWSQVQGRL